MPMRSDNAFMNYDGRAQSERVVTVLFDSTARRDFVLDKLEKCGSQLHYEVPTLEEVIVDDYIPREYSVLKVLTLC